MDNLKTLIDKLITESKLDEAFKLLLETSKDIKSNVYDDIVLLQSQFVKNENENTNHIISREDYQLTDNKIKNAIQQKVRDIQKTITAANNDVVSSIESDEIKIIGNYIEREKEDDFIRKILKPNEVLKIKGPTGFGKTQLLSRITEFANKNNHITVNIDFDGDIPIEILKNHNKLLTHICIQTTIEMDLENRITDYWTYPDDPNMNFRIYFEKYLFKASDKPVVLIIDNVDRIIEFEDVSKNFFAHLRSLYNNATKSGSKSKQWQKFKQILAYSTEFYLVLDINKSPFNIGVDYTLKGFKMDEVLTLAKANGASLNNDQISRLLEILEGHPKLTVDAINSLVEDNYTYDELIEQAYSDDGPFGNYLVELYNNLVTDQEALDEFKLILRTNESHKVQICNRLKKAGIIKGEVPNVQPASELYKQYFEKKL
jgi:hypothetical protein